jgi:hypothetical protein
MKALTRVLTGTALATGLFSLFVPATPAVADNNIKYVLLISIDGMHALDFANCANGIASWFRRRD